MKIGLIASALAAAAIVAGGVWTVASGLSDLRSEIGELRGDIVALRGTLEIRQEWDSERIEALSRRMDRMER